MTALADKGPAHSQGNPREQIASGRVEGQITTRLSSKALHD